MYAKSLKNPLNSVLSYPNREAFRPFSPAEMAMDQKTLTITASATILRLIIFFVIPSIPDFFTSQVEVSTPVSSFKRLQEGLFLYRRGVSPYDGGVFHQAPILLIIFEIIPWPGVIFTALDLLNALALGNIATSGLVVGNSKSPRALDRLDSRIISTAYLLNPFTIVACLGRSTTAFTNAAIIQAASSACEGHLFRTMLALAFASYLSIYPVLLLLPLLLLCWDKVTSTKEPPIPASSFISRSIGTFACGVAALVYSTPLITGSWDFVDATYGAQLSVPDLTPNIGLWWYFFTEIFDSFRNFFIGVFWLHLASYVGGLSLRLRGQPLFVLTTMLGLLAIFKPYPSISDVSLYLAFVPLFKHIFSLMQYTFIASSVLLYATLLGPAFHYLWIYAGSGNANFFYAITLVWSLGLAILVGDSLFAILRDEWEIERPEMKGKEVRRI